MGRPRKLPHGTEIVRLHDVEGLSIAQIAERFGAKPAAVTNRMHKDGCYIEKWHPRKCRAVTKPIDMEKALQLRNDLVSRNEAARVLGVSCATLDKRLREAGIAKWNINVPAVGELIALRRRGWTLLQIGEKYGVSESGISRRISRALEIHEALQPQSLWRRLWNAWRGL